MPPSKSKSSSNPDTKPTKAKAVDAELESVLADINKTLGEGSIMSMSEGRKRFKVDTVSTGCVSLDIAIGGGIPRGRIIELMGEESSGKTTMAIHMMVEFQKLGHHAAIVDAEHAFDPEYAEKLGIDMKRLWIAQPDSGEDALTIVEKLVKSGKFGIIVIDSVAALTPRSELEGQMGDAQMGGQARMMGQAMRKLTAITGKSNTTLVFLNQVRCLPVDTMVCIDGVMSFAGDMKKGHSVVLGSDKTTKILNVHHTGMLDGVKIATRYRGDFEISDSHIQPIIRSGEMSEVRGAEIKDGDWLIQPILSSSTIKKDSPYLKTPDGRVIDEDFAFFLGCYYSDGYMIGDGKNYFISFTENNKERYALVDSICSKLFPDNNRPLPKSKRIAVVGKNIVKMMDEIGVGRGGRNKIIPSYILKSRSSVIKEFIRGAFFDTHGFGEKGFIFTNENPETTSQFKDLLYYFGIFADLRKDGTDWFNRLYITGNDAISFREIIGFAEPSKQKILSSLSAAKNARGKYDVVPAELGKRLFNYARSSGAKGVSSIKNYSAIYMCTNKGLNVCRLSLLNYLKSINYIDDVIKNSIMMLESNRFTEIQKVQRTSFDAVDVEVEGGLFVASSFLTHNCKIGVVYGDPMTTPGGNALKFFASVRLRISRTKAIETGTGVKKEFVASPTKVKVMKNKIAPPFKTAEFIIRFNQGIDKLHDVAVNAVKFGIAEQAGAFISFDGKKYQGIEKFKEALSDVKLFDMTAKKLMATMSSVDMDTGEVFEEAVEPVVEQTVETVEPDPVAEPEVADADMQIVTTDGVPVDPVEEAPSDPTAGL